VSRVKLPKRLPSGEAEKVQKTVHILFIFRRFYFKEIAHEKDNLLPLEGMPLPKRAKSSYFKFRAGMDYGYFICPVSAKKSVLRYFAIEEGALIIMDPPPNAAAQSASTQSSLSLSIASAFSPKRSTPAQSPQSSPAPQHKHPTAAVVGDIIPLESRYRDGIRLRSNNIASTSMVDKDGICFEEEDV